MTTPKKVTWADPPGPLRPTFTWFWKQLRQNPGKWAVYPGVNRTTTNIRKRSVEGGRYEATVKDGQMLVRFVSDKTKETT